MNLKSSHNFLSSHQIVRKKKPQKQPQTPFSQTKRWSYKPLIKLGQGTFGTVSSAIDSDGSLVAVKKVVENPSFKNREIEVNELLDSPYCVKMKHHYRVKNDEDGTTTLYIVMEYLQISLGKQLAQFKLFREPLSPSALRHYSMQIFKGLEYMHSLHVCHRDIKPENILVNPNSLQVKLCDFGSSKIIVEGEHNSPNIGSRFYRSPEILLGCESYDLSIDIWSAGCVIAQMLLNNDELFNGVDDEDQLKEIIKVIGFPSEEENSSFSHKKAFPKCEKITDLVYVLPSNIDPRLLDLLRSIFQYDPRKRPTASQCLKSPYFMSSSFSCLPSLHTRK